MCAAGMFLWGGVRCTVMLRGVQFRKLGRALLVPFCREKNENSGALSSFEASSAALAGAIGTGNITGVAGAVAIGGAGAVFWMWVSAFLGMAVKYAEIFLAAKYREERPCAYLYRAGKRGRLLWGAFCLAGAAAAPISGALVQTSALSQAVVENTGIGGWLPFFLGLGAAAVTAFAVSGGAKGVGKLSAVLMPVMGGLYLFGALWVIGRNGEKLPAVFREIIVSAFDFRAASGGAWFLAVRCGVERGVFSHEAGLGTGALAHEFSGETDPHREGLWGIFEVFVDTVLLCSLTAFALLVTGEDTAIGAFSVEMGAAGGLLVTGCSVIFALSSLFPWFVYGKRCLCGVTGRRGSWYLPLYLTCIAIAPLLPAGILWDSAGLVNALMAAPNLIGVIRHLDRRHIPPYTAE